MASRAASKKSKMSKAPLPGCIATGVENVQFLKVFCNCLAKDLRVKILFPRAPQGSLGGVWGASGSPEEFWGAPGSPGSHWERLGVPGSTREFPGVPGRAKEPRERLGTHEDP